MVLKERHHAWQKLYSTKSEYDCEITKHNEPKLVKGYAQKNVDMRRPSLKKSNKTLEEMKPENTIELSKENLSAINHHRCAFNERMEHRRPLMKKTVRSWNST